MQRSALAPGQRSVHMDLQVEYVFVMRLGRLARAKCVLLENAGLAAIVFRDLGHDT